jgi:tetratricopeptide (TPR) repeat protein
MISRSSIGRKIETVLRNKKVSSEEEANSVLREYFTKHNVEMERVNQKLGGGIGTFLAEADKLIQQRKYQKAIKLCDFILDAYSECDEALLMKLTAGIAIGNYESADACFEKYKEINPNNPEVYLLKWQLELEKILKTSTITAEDLQRTITFLNTAIKIDSQYFDALISKAQILFWLGDDEYKKLIHKCRRVDALRTDNFLNKHWIEDIPDCHPLAVISNSVSKIESLMSNGDYQQALNEINKIIDKDMEQGLKEVLHSLKIDGLICLNDYQQAKEVISDLISLNKDYPKSYFHRAVIHFKCSDFNEALEAINQCIAVAEKASMKHFEYYKLKATILKQLGKDNWQDFEKMAEKVKKENNKMFEKLCKQKGINPEKTGFD